MRFSSKGVLRFGVAAAALMVTTGAQSCGDASVAEVPSPSSSTSESESISVPTASPSLPSSSPAAGSSSSHSSSGGSSSGTTMCFPDGFFFGAATSAYQVEGGVNATGRTPSVWEIACQSGDMECANVADDFVNRYESDIELMQADGYGAFRLSLSWSRIMTWSNETQRMVANPEGIAFYHSMIDELLVAGIEPVVTMFHWDTPYELYALGDFLNASIVDHFVDYADVVLKEYGQKVKFWSTINEPHSYISIVYIWMYLPEVAPDSDSDEYEAAHNLILAHASAVQRFRELQSSGVVLSEAKISIVVSGGGVPLNTSDPADVEAADRFMQFKVGWWLSPLVSGDYPATMRERVGDRLPTFSEEEAALVKGSYDLFMYNFYYADQITDCSSATSDTNCSSLSAGWSADMGVDSSHTPSDAVYANQSSGLCSGHFGYPPSYLDCIEWVYSQDTSTTIMLTENGWCGNSTIDNQDQLWYFRTHLEQVYKGIYEKNIPIVGYLAWSLLDNFEWGSYDSRYGLYYVDYPENIGDTDLYSLPSTELTRTPRSAAKFFSSVATTGCLEVAEEDLKWL